MRRTPLLTRAIVSFVFTLMLALLMSSPFIGRHASVLARPLQQAAVNLTVDQDTKYGDPNTSVTYTFTITNNSGTQQSFSVGVSGSSFNPQFNTPITVANGGSASFPVRFTIGNETPGTRDQATVTVTGNTGNPVPQASLVVTTIVTINGRTATPTVEVATSTPTATVGPSPTAGPLCRDVYEPDNTLDSARELRPDEPQGNHATCPLGDEDWLFFSGVGGKVYTIDVSEMTAGLDLTLGLYDAQGNLMAFNDDFPRSNDPADVANIRPRIQSYRLPANGKYYIRVRDNAGRGGTNLSYTIELQSESYGPTPTLIPEICTDLFEPDGVPEQARLMVIRETQPNHKFCPAGDADWVRFFAKTTEQYTLRTNSNARAGADPVMILVDRDGATILDLNDDSNGTLDAQISFQPAVDGFYYAQIKNVGDIGNQFIAYDLIFEPIGAGSGSTPPTPTLEPGAPTITPTTTETPSVTITGTPPTETATSTTPTTTAYPSSDLGGVKGAPDFVNGPATGFVDQAFARVWNHTDQVIATRKTDRSWMWGPGGLVARAEVYSQSRGGARQVQYFDKARMEITDWKRDRNNPWYVTNGLLVKELIEGRMQIGDNEFLARSAAAIGIAGDSDDQIGPTYASFARHLGRTEDRTGKIAATALRRDGSTAGADERAEARLVHYVPETGHNIPQVFWDFLNASGPVDDGSRNDVLVDWVFAMGYPVSEPYWTKVKVGGVERDVLVQAFQRRVLTYTPSNPDGWQVEMGNVGRHYYAWRYGRQP